MHAAQNKENFVDSFDDKPVNQYRNPFEKFVKRSSVPVNTRSALDQGELDGFAKVIVKALRGLELNED